MNAAVRAHGPAQAQDEGTGATSLNLDGVRRASASRRAAALLTDLAVLGAMATAAGLALGLLGAAVGAVAGAVAGPAVLTRTGSSVGHALWGLRVVDQRTGLPPTLAATPSRLVVADTRAGRDPLRLSPVALPQIQWAPTATAAGATAAPAQWLKLLADDGFTYVIDRPTIVGRRPVDESGNYTPLVLSDVSRSLSRTHAAFVPGDGFIFVLDVGSGNGTSIEVGGELVAVPAGQFAHAPLGARVRMGSRHFDVVAA